jgi:molybdopterin converting factor small subunit
MKILLQSFSNIKEVLGSGELEIELPPESCLTELFAELERRFGAAFNRQIRDQFTGEMVPFLILVNGKALRSTVDLSASLHNSDLVTIMIPFDGG